MIMYMQICIYVYSHVCSNSVCMQQVRMYVVGPYVCSRSAVQKRKVFFPSHVCICMCMQMCIYVCQRGRERYIHKMCKQDPSPNIAPGDAGQQSANIYMYLYIYIYIYTHTHILRVKGTYIHAYMHTCIHVQTGPQSKHYPWRRRAARVHSQRTETI